MAGLERRSRSRLAFKVCDEISWIAEAAVKGVVGIFGGERREFTLALVEELCKENRDCVVVCCDQRFLQLGVRYSRFRAARLGVNASLNPFKPVGEVDPEDYAVMLVELLMELLDLDQLQARYLLRALRKLYEGERLDPSVEEVDDALLAVEAEITARELFKLEAVRGLLEELSTGGLAAVFSSCSPISEEELLSKPSILDLSQIPGARFKALAAALTLLKKLLLRRSLSFIMDEAALVFSPGGRRTRKHCLLELLDGQAVRGGAVLLGLEPSEFSADVYARCAVKVFTKPLSIGSGRNFNELTPPSLPLYSGEALVVSEDQQVSLVRFKVRESLLTEEELAEELRIPREWLPRRTGRRSLLQRILGDRFLAEEAYKLLCFLRGNRAPYNGLKGFSNLPDQLFEGILRALLRHKLIASYFDDKGIRWFVVTDLGEQAADEYSEKTGGDG